MSFLHRIAVQGTHAADPLAVQAEMVPGAAELDVGAILERPDQGAEEAAVGSLDLHHGSGVEGVCIHAIDDVGPRRARRYRSCAILGASAQRVSLAEGLGDELRPRACADLGHGVPDVGPDGVVGNAELVGDLRSAAPTCDMSDDLLLALGQRPGLRLVRDIPAEAPSPT